MLFMRRDVYKRQALDRLHVLSCLTRNAELIIVPDQPVQPLKTPEKDTLLFPQQFVHPDVYKRQALISELQN